MSEQVFLGDSPEMRQASASAQRSFKYFWRELSWERRRIIPDERGWTMLHHEAIAGNFGVVKLLVQYGANANALTPDGRNAATLAQTIGWPEIASYLASHSP